MVVTAKSSGVASETRKDDLGLEIDENGFGVVRWFS